MEFWGSLNFWWQNEFMGKETKAESGFCGIGPAVWGQELIITLTKGPRALVTASDQGGDCPQGVNWDYCHILNTK